MSKKIKLITKPQKLKDSLEGLKQAHEAYSRVSIPLSKKRNAQLAQLNSQFEEGLKTIEKAVKKAMLAPIKKVNTERDKAEMRIHREYDKGINAMQIVLDRARRRRIADVGPEAHHEEDMRLLEANPGVPLVGDRCP